VTIVSTFRLLEQAAEKRRITTPNAQFPTPMRQNRSKLPRCAGASPIKDCPPSSGAWFDVVLETYSCRCGVARFHHHTSP
jgi:hypothetical protein